MKILRLTIRSWRNLRDVDLTVPQDSPLVCLVGENGTGKSAILELLSAAAHSLGISQGVETNRGNPFQEEHDLSLLVQVPITDLPDTSRLLDESGLIWDGQLTLVSAQGTGQQMTAEGLTDSSRSVEIANLAINELRSRNETQHLFLDADRAYPPSTFNPQQLIEIWNQDYRAPEFNRQWSYRPTRTLYGEWIKYLVGIEERTGAQLIADTRTARASGKPDAVFVDPFDNYRALLHQTLPHLMFVGIQTSGAQRTGGCPAERVN